MSIVITGTPGVGKHMIAEKIMTQIKLQMVDINCIAEEAKLLEHDGETADVDVSKLEEILQDRLKKSCLVVGHLAPYILYPKQTKLVIVLRRNPYDLLTTYKNRGYSDAKCMENAASEILGVIFYDAKVRFGDMVVQVDISDADTAVQKVFDVICGRGGNSNVDWLETTARNGDLAKFFSY